MRLACIRHTGPYWEIGKAFGELDAWARERGIRDTLLVGLYYDDPRTTAPEQLGSDAAVVLPDHVQTVDGATTLQEVPAQTCAVARHVGSYAGLPQAWGDLHDEIGRRGYRLACAPSMEIYRNNCADTPEDQLVTDLCVPLER